MEQEMLLRIDCVWCDPYLGLGRCSIRRITFACIEYRNAIDLPWDKFLVPKDHPRYYFVKDANIIQY